MIDESFIKQLANTQQIECVCCHAYFGFRMVLSAMDGQPISCVPSHCGQTSTRYLQPGLPLCLPERCFFASPDVVVLPMVRERSSHGAVDRWRSDETWLRVGHH